MTTEEAKTKVCPFMQLTPNSQYEGCIAEDCMAWDKKGYCKRLEMRCLKI